jgi:probable F420-dependent oxidoreductase
VDGTRWNAPICGPRRINLNRVEFSHPAPRHALEYDLLYGAPGTFLTLSTTLVFAAEADEPSPSVLIAALGPRMLEAARELADGSHPYQVTQAQTAEVRAALGLDKTVAVEMGAVLTSDRETALRRAHARLDIYTGLPNYRNNWLQGGFDETDLVRGGSDRLAEALVAWGDEAVILS